MGGKKRKTYINIRLTIVLVYQKIWEEKVAVS